MTPAKINIVTYLGANPQTSVVKLIDQFGISKQALHKHLKELIEEGEIQKQGLPPKVFYSKKIKIDVATYDFLDQTKLTEFVTISASGEKLNGQIAFAKWCNDRGFDITKYYQIYVETKNRYKTYYDSNGLINATSKIQNTFGADCYVDNCFYSSFSAIEIFGRTGIYAQMLYAKQSGNKKNMQILLPDFAQKVQLLIMSKNIQAIGFVPPTVPRKVQLMKEIEKYLSLSLPKIIIQKISNEYIVPQKTLSKPNERRQNAQNTFAVEYVPNVKNILLIDDFVGSGSSFNFIAQKIKTKHNCNITCLAISGTPNGIVNNQNNKFEIINEA